LSESLSYKQLIKYFLLILLFGIAIGCVSLIYPFGRDQGIYAYIGKLLLEGKIQYKYAFDLKPPGVHYVFALAELIFGQSMCNIRIFDLLWQSLTAFVIFFITFNYTRSKVAGLVSSFLYIFLYYRLDYWHTLQADGFLNLPFSLCILMLMISKENAFETKMLIAGILFGVTVLFKYTLLVFIPFFVIWLLANRKIYFIVRFKNTALFFAGFLFLIGFITGIYYLTDALKQFINIQFVQIPLYAGIGFSTESISFIISNLFRLFFGSVYSPLILSCFFLSLILIRTNTLTVDKTLFFVWVISVIINLVVQWKFFHYHFLVIIPPIVVGTSMLFKYVHDSYYQKHPSLVNFSFAIIIIVYLVFAARPYVYYYENLVAYTDGKKSMEELYIKTGITSDSAFMMSNTLKAVEYVKNNTKLSDKIYVWGFDPVVYYLSGRECVSKFIYNFPLYWKGNNSSFQKEFLDAIISDNPKLILVSQKDPLYYISGYREDSKQMLVRFPEFKEFIDKKYVFKVQIENFLYYELKSEI
jgi:4-amino-4-deoxy-L-arabinose transferase-like glycosyltransferase